MGRRGPPPTPTESLKLRGSTLVTKRRRRNEAKGPSGVPGCPDWLDGDGKAMWKTLVPPLEGKGVLSDIDRNALSRYCRLWSRWRNAESFIDTHGEMYPLRDDSGRVQYMQQWPQVAIANKLAQQLTRLEQEFGMTPSARSRMQIERRTSEKDHGKARFFEAG